MIQTTVFVLTCFLFFACNGSGGRDSGIPGDGDPGDAGADPDDSGAEDGDGGYGDGDWGVDSGDEEPGPQHPTYAANVANWTDGAPTAGLDVVVNGLEAAATGTGSDPSASGGISACSYNFGDDSAPVEVSADAQGNCEPVTHTYTQAGGYSVVLAVWDDLGMVGQDSTTIQAGPPRRDRGYASDRCELG